MSEPKPKASWGGPRNYPKYRAEKRIIATLTERGPLSAKDLAELVFLAPGGITSRLRRLRKGLADFPKLRIAGWEPPENCGPHAPLYAIGDEPDAVLVRTGRYAPDRKRRDMNATRKAFLLELATHGPLTRHELAAHFGLTLSGAWRVLVSLQKGVVPLARVRVCGFDRTRSGQQTPRYAIGNAYDAKPVHMTRKERNARTYQKYRAVIEARRTGRYASPFDGLLKAAA